MDAEQEADRVFHGAAEDGAEVGMSNWVRLWEDMPSDPKWRVVAKKAGRPIPEVIAVFNFMLICASRTQPNAGELMGWDDEDVGAAMDMKEAEVRAIRQAMEGKIILNNRLKSWEKRQPLREDGSAARARAWRTERNRTQPNAPEEKREDKIRKKEKLPLVAKRKTQINDNARLEDGDLEFAKKHGTHAPVEEWAQFCDHHRKLGNLMVDWHAAWRTWVRNTKKFSHVRPELNRNVYLGREAQHAVVDELVRRKYATESNGSSENEATSKLPEIIPPRPALPARRG
jgi:hypothetical protein